MGLGIRAVLRRLVPRAQGEQSGCPVVLVHEHMIREVVRCVNLAGCSKRETDRLLTKASKSG